MRFWIAVCLLACIGVAKAAEPMTVVVNASVQFAPLFYAKEKGLFAEHGLDVTVQMIGLNSNIPPLLVAGSAQLGGTTSSVLLQADDNGLDLLAVAGAGISDATTKDSALLIAPNSSIKTPADLVGKAVGVPGIGAILDVLFRNWLIAQHIDTGKIHFVETDLAQQADLLHKGSVDAVIGNNPSMARIIASGNGRILAYFTEALPGAVPMVVYAASAQWIAGHAAAVAGFRAVNEEAVAHIKAHPEDGQAAMGRFLKMPADVVKDVTMPPLQADVSMAQMQTTIDIMRQQDMLHSHLDAAKLVAPLTEP